MNHPHIQSPFRFRDPMLFRAKAHLTDEAIELTGWHWHGRYTRRIPLAEVLHADARTRQDLVLWLVGGEVVRLHLEQAARWEAAITNHLPAMNTPS